MDCAHHLVQHCSPNTYSQQVLPRPTPKTASPNSYSHHILPISTPNIYSNQLLQTPTHNTYCQRLLLTTGSHHLLPTSTPTQPSAPPVTHDAQGKRPVWTAVVAVILVCVRYNNSKISPSRPGISPGLETFQN